MCGIVGMVGDNIDHSRLVSMTRSIAHRGPDDEGFYISKRAHLGFRRLSIIDLSMNAHQPMTSPDDRYTIVFNGEIYNFRTLREDLIQKGFIFKSRSDCEVLLHGFVQWGKDILQKLNGMFAFAIWDNLKQELFAARDRVGIKPLYYYYDPEKKYFVFGSELKIFLEHADIETSISVKALNQYLHYGSVSQPLTIFENIEALLPGHSILVSKDNVIIQPYWKYNTSGSSQDFSSPLEKLDELLRQTVADQVMSDVPCGAFLSGGVDSSLLASYMSELVPGPIETISIGFPLEEHHYNEISTAKKTAETLGSNHHEIIIEPEDVLCELGSFVKSLDQPSYDGFNSYCVSKYARKHVTVALSGLGGDELFLGYNHHRLMFQRRKAMWLLQLMYPACRPALKKILKIWKNGFEKSVVKQIQSILENPSNLAAGSWNHYFTHFNVDEINMLLRPDKTYGIIFDNKDSLAQLLSSHDITYYMRDTLLRDTDVMSMAHSLEVRVPFLDNRILDFASNLPLKHKINKQWGTKAILRQLALKRHLSSEIIYGKKRGFELPIESWLRGPLKTKINECLLNANNPLSEMFNDKSLRLLINSFHASPKVPYIKVWLLFVLFDWYDNCIADRSFPR